MADFSTIAQYYDQMTNFDKRLVGDFGVIKHLVERFKVKSALDAGCGTGVHSIILAKLGIEVVGVDSAAEMVEGARVNSLREGLQLEFIKDRFEALPLGWSEKFDTIFCLANSLVGVETAERLSLSFKSFQRVLKPGGRAVIQLLNFTHYRSKNIRVLKVSSNQNLTFVRFFDFEEEVTRLNVLIIEHDMGQVKHQFISQPILPVNSEVIQVAASMSGFSGVEYYSDLSLSEPYHTDGENLVAVITR